MENKKVVITQPSNPTENIQVKSDFYEGDSLGGIIFAISFLVTALAELVKAFVPVMEKKKSKKKNNK